jgi:hypothetical protein
MAGRGNPSFLKNQKARKRQEKAAAKRAARQTRRDEKANRAAAGVEEPTDDVQALEGETIGEELGGDEAEAEGAEVGEDRPA